MMDLANFIAGNAAFLLVLFLIACVCAEASE